MGINEEGWNRRGNEIPIHSFIEIISAMSIADRTSVNNCVSVTKKVDIENFELKITVIMYPEVERDISKANERTASHIKIRSQNKKGCMNGENKRNSSKYGKEFLFKRRLIWNTGGTAIKRKEKKIERKSGNSERIQSLSKMEPIRIHVCIGVEMKQEKWKKMSVNMIFHLM